jgi:aspartate-semialdehyde dehydrogenase
MDPAVPLVVPEVNPTDACDHRGIIAGPNCSTIQMVVALWPLHQVNPIQRIVVDTYQSVSGAGWKGLDELQKQAEDHVAGRPPRLSLYKVPIHQNLIPEIGSLKADGLYSEELKMIQETRKIFHAPQIAISATCVRVPVPVAHSEAMHVELERPMAPEEAREILRRAPGVEVIDDPAQSRYPIPMDAAGRDAVYVGRIRRDPSHPRAINLWVVSDNLLKGAATNAVQIAEVLHERGLVRVPAGQTA